MAGGIWAPFKELVRVVNDAILRKEPTAYYKLESELKKHKPDFLSLLKNPSKNAAHRAMLQKDGLKLPNFPNLHSLPQDYIKEALLISDILDLNEVSSIELLLAGEQQLPYFPSYTRGLVAVLLYHDGRRSIVSALRTLIQAREGVAWTIGLSPAIVTLVTAFTAQLFEEGLVGKILALLESVTVEGELSILAKGKGIGGPKHRQEIVELVTEQRAVLADCLLFWACQNPFPREETLKVLQCLKKVQVETPSSLLQSSNAALPGQQVPQEYAPMDPTSLALLLTLLACFNIGDTSAEGLSGEGASDDRYPVLTDGNFVPALHTEMLKNDGWATPELCKAVQFAWGVLLREYASRPAFTDRSEPEDDEELVDEGIRYGAFHFLRQCVIASPHFHQEEFYVRRVHWLLTSFIVNMHLKVKDLRNLGDEVAKEVVMRGGDMSLVSSERRGFEELMRLIGDLYSSDPNNLQLSSEFWPIADSALHQSSLHTRTPHRQISLYKFLSTCSNFLPSPLFSAFMHMLTGLSSSPLTAHHCFNLLKANSPTLGGGGASAAISLEHFFTSLRQYYLGLRNGGGARAPPAGCAISPQEVQGLKDVLTIISTIARQDENARVVMYENQSWLPVASLFGLIGCPIPRDLKAMVLQTLATFALSPEIAGSMWHTLEVAQVLNTAHTPGAGGAMAGVFGHQVTQEGNLQVELEEIESQAEEYPLTRAFLDLLLVLIKVPIPPTLGVGRRVRGFDPYLVFVRDAVFLKFDSRAYRDRNEKWEVARLSLDILCQLLSSHVMSAEDFTDQQYNLPEGGVVTISKPPGHVILKHMLNDSLLLKKVLSVVDEALLVLSAHSPTPPPEGVAHAALLCLQLLAATLEREEEFLDLVRKTKNQVSVHPLHSLLLGVNPRSGKADHMVNIARYVGLTRCSPELALAAVQVVHGVAQTPRAGIAMTTTIVGDKDVYPVVIQGFVEHFDVEVQSPPDQQEEATADSLETTDGVHRAIQSSILKLLSSCVDLPAPNIAHLLLGFETGNGKHIAETMLQDPGISGSPRTCLHSLLAMVDRGVGLPISAGCHFAHPQLAELCYKVLHQLCSHRDLSVPTLRYLRNNHDFLHTQLTHLPLDASQLPPSSNAGDSDSAHRLLSPAHVSLLHQQAWLMRSAAIELRMTLLNHLRSHTQRLLNLLLSEPSSESGRGVGQLGVASSHQGKEGLEFVQEGRRKILVLLDMVDFQDHNMPNLDMEYFDPSAVEGVIKLCEVKDGVSGLVSCDVKQLHKMLMMELNTAQGPSLAGHYQGILEEVHKVLAVVVQRNQVAAASHLSLELFESWRQLMETALHAMLQDDIKRELKVAVLFELIQDLLIKVGQCESPPLTTSVHGVILILLSHLRQTVLSNPTPSETEDSLLSSLYSGPLLAIMSGLLENILKAPAGMQQVRVYLYGSLLYYLSMSKSNEEEREEVTRGKGLWQAESEMSTMAAANLSTLNSFGEPFMDLVCRNACSGHDVARMLSLSVLDSVLSLDRQTVWLRFLTQRGYLQTLCASLQWEDDSLRKMLHPVPEALRALYIYESKMAFLTQVANNPLGARELTSINALNYLSQCKFIDLRPSSHGSSHMMASQHSHGFIPSVSDRYRQLLFPVLKLLLALLTCPGSHHIELATQVTSLIGAHSDVFAAILKEQHAVVTMATLQELALVTAVIANSGVGNDWSSQSSTPFVSGLIRLQRLMLTLLPQFWSRQGWQKLVETTVQEEEEQEEGGGGGGGGGKDTILANQAFLLVQQISANIVSYCRVAMTIGGKEFSSPYCRVLLTPDLSEALAIPPNQDPFASPSSSSGTRPPSLGLLIQHLKECTDGFAVAFESYQHYSKKMEVGTPLSSEDIRQLLPRSTLAKKLSLSQQQPLARKHLKTRVSSKKRELQQYTYVVENLLFLLWRHLQYYLLYCTPMDPEPNLMLTGTGRTPMRRLEDEASFAEVDPSFDLSTLCEGVRSQDLEQLKTNSVKCLTDALFKKLLDLEEADLSSHRDVVKVEFVQALVRRIKRLLKLKAGPFQTFK